MSYSYPVLLENIARPPDNIDLIRLIRRSVPHQLFALLSRDHSQRRLLLEAQALGNTKRIPLRSARQFES